jgi:hypothetical protein
MDKADISGFFRTVIWMVLIYYAIKYLFRLLGPFLLQKAVHKVEKNFQEKARDFYSQAGNQYNEGYSQQQKQTSEQNSKSEINVNDLREKKKVGEYIDFEELN